MRKVAGVSKVPEVTLFIADRAHVEEGPGCLTRVVTIMEIDVCMYTQCARGMRKFSPLLPTLLHMLHRLHRYSQVSHSLADRGVKIYIWE